MFLFRNITNYFVFIPAKTFIKYFSDTTWIYSWKYDGMSEENIENITKSDIKILPTSANHHIFSDTNFNGHCLINNNISIPKKVINLFISYTPNPWLKKFKHRFYIK